MVLTKLKTPEILQQKSVDTTSKKRRDRRNKLKAARYETKFQAEQSFIDEQSSELHTRTLVDNVSIPNNQKVNIPSEKLGHAPIDQSLYTLRVDSKLQLTMSSKEVEKPRENVLAAREVKRLAKQKAKNNCDADTIAKNNEPGDVAQKTKNNAKADSPSKTQNNNEVQSNNLQHYIIPARGKDETDRVVKETDVVVEGSNETKDKIKAERAAKRAAKQAKKKGAAEGDADTIADTNMTVRDVVTTLKDIVNVAKNIEEVTAKVQAINLEAKKPLEESSKSKAELRAERRAKQEAQRAAKQVTQADKQTVQADKQAATKQSLETSADKAPKKVSKEAVVKEKSPKPNAVEKKQKPQSGRRVNWFQHLYPEHDKEALKKVALNSNLHPAIIKLGVQLSSRVVTGSNARCIALLDALKQMVRDFVVPARAEFARGLETQLSASVAHLWAQRAPAAAQTNALNYLRHRLQQLPNDVDEFDAKKHLQEEMERYVREQIDTAGEAISLTVRDKIAHGDHVLTYGCSSLIERILREAWESDVQFRTVVVGNRVQRGGREMLRRLVAHGLPCTYVDITALGHVMHTVNKVVVGASALLANGWVVGAVGTAQVALAARARNVPVLVAAETHKFCGRVQTDAFVYNELGDPDDLIDKSDENSPLKSWRSNPNLTPLNLTYDVTPPRLVTAVVTELAMLPCTSAPVVLRFKLAEYGG